MHGFFQKTQKWVSPQRFLCPVVESVDNEVKGVSWVDGQIIQFDVTFALDKTKRTGKDHSNGS